MTAPSANSNHASKYVSAGRLNRRLDVMARYGATEKRGVNRQALSAEDLQAQLQMVRWAAELELRPSTDPAGNLFIRYEGTDPALAPILTGSHLDSQPTGGRFDGVYGVLAALEAVEAIRDAGLRPQRSIEIVSWMNEEGSRFAPGMMGSRAYANPDGLADILSTTDADGVSVSSALEIVHKGLRDVPHRMLGGRPYAYIETHIEQGPELERQNTTIGVVSGIQGKRTFRVTISGEAAHAGTSCRAVRKDALMAAVRIIGALDQQFDDKADVVKFTVGRLTVEPNAPSVVPSAVTFSIDLRHPESAELTRLGDLVVPICEAQKGPCAVSVKELSTAMSVEFAHELRNCIRRAADQLKIAHLDILSAAGHDARYLGDVCPSAMIFVPSHQGITHNEAEFTSLQDLVDGARVLADVLCELTSQEASSCRAS
ncbi:N-carbamoyl-L-amino-acid hydrolase [Bradyrhizobium ottawaense]|uniref:M20 family metallo-hydrolase n=1 Tax=Bradyrhizobium TaxID=374 RepID=UPI00216163D7|nr:M20 family metallo-hydrolase [Bradyrhizobium arachidis]UVO32318.1 M20 family metallo-hydrolase [Bradyrhizobium arachidis]